MYSCVNLHQNCAESRAIPVKAEVKPMTFPRYESYKDSGIEWLGKVPEHWIDLPLKSVTTHNDDALDENISGDYEILYVDISSVDFIDGISLKETMLFSMAPSRARRCVKHGDVIVSTVRTYLRTIARIYKPEDNLVVSTGFCVVRISRMKSVTIWPRMAGCMPPATPRTMTGRGHCSPPMCWPGSNHSAESMGHTDKTFPGK